MRRKKPQYSTTQRFAGANRQDKYWVAWAERQALAPQPTTSTVRVLVPAPPRCKWGHIHRTSQAMSRCRALLGG